MDEPTPWLDFFSNLTAGGIGAFIGAWFAFRFERQSKVDDDEAEDIRQGNLAQLTLFRQWNVFAQYRNERINPSRALSSAQQAMDMVPALNLLTVQSLDIAALGFLLDNTGKDLLPNLALSEDRHRSLHVMNAIRAQLHEIIVNTHAQPGESEFKVPHGDLNFRKLDQITRSFIADCDGYVTSTWQLMSDLRANLKRRFPSAKFMLVEEPDIDRPQWGAPVARTDA